MDRPPFSKAIHNETEAKGNSVSLMDVISPSLTMSAASSTF
jgi:hypothetical protein